MARRGHRHWSPQQRAHWVAEQVLNWSGLPTVHIRAAIFVEAMYGFAEEADGDADVASPTAPQRALPRLMDSPQPA